jgi:anti-anti-sigma factor
MGVTSHRYSGAVSRSQLDVAAERAADEVRLLVTGEVDLRTADGLEQEAFAALGSRIGRLVLDFAGVTFCDSSGVAVLVRIYNEGGRRGTRIVLRNVDVHTRRVLEISGLLRVLPIED